MNIEKYISDLLYRYQCVTIPSFGAFLTEFKSAQINTTSNVMLPPKKVLTFNPHLINNDGLLANHIAIELNIPYEEAVSAINSEVEKWNLKLEFGETLVLENIGDIVKNHEGNIVFAPSNLINFNTDSFGLTDIVTPNVDREESNTQPSVEVKPSEQAAKTAIEKHFEAKLPLAETLLMNPDEEEVIIEPVKTKSNKKATIISIAAAVALFIGSVYAYKVYDDTLNENVNSIVNKGSQNKDKKQIQEASFVMSAPTSDTADTQVDNTIVDEQEKNIYTAEDKQVEPEVINPVATESIQSKTQISNTSSLPYHIIAGSFKSEENAKNRAKDLQNNGYKDAAIIGKNGQQLYMVAYKSFSDYRSAVNELKTIQDNENGQAWIFTK